MKKSILATILIFIVAFIGFVGVHAISHHEGHGINCNASQVIDIECPEDIVSMAVHHIFALQKLTISMISVDFLLIIFLILVVSGGYIFFKYLLFEKPLSHGFSFYKKQNKIHVRQKFRHWLSLFEVSPPFVESAPL